MMTQEYMLDAIVVLIRHCGTQAPVGTGAQVIFLVRHECGIRAAHAQRGTIIEGQVPGPVRFVDREIASELEREFIEVFERSIEDKRVGQVLLDCPIEQMKLFLTKELVAVPDGFCSFELHSSRRHGYRECRRCPRPGTR